MNTQKTANLIKVTDTFEGIEIRATTMKLHCNKCGNEWVATIRNGYLVEWDLDCLQCKGRFTDEHWEQARDS